jgi:hypothetical protein
MTTAKETEKLKRPMETSLTDSRVGFLLPVASDEELVEGFKRYVALKDKLLEEGDYVWYALYRVGEKMDRKGFNTRAEAESFIKTLVSRGATADLEKRVRKSGCLKLGKAFGISTIILEEKLDREKGFAEYRMRATAANGQVKEKTGSCDRSEKGKAQVPFDTLMGTACTRAEDRAIMALLGGETTAEEMSENSAELPANPAVPAQQTPPPKSAELPANPAVKTDAQIATEVKAAVAASAKPLGPLPPEVQKSVDEITAKFGGTDPAKPVTKNTLIGWMFQASKKANLTVEELKRGIVNKYRVESTKELTEAQLIELTHILVEIEKDKDRKF